MDKYEYKVRSEEIEKLMKEERYADAAGIADTIDWRRVRNLSTLLNIAWLYKKNTRNEDSREILLLAYEKYPTNRAIVFELCDISIKLDDVVAAIGYFNQYRKLAPKDNGVIILRYRILEAQGASIEERIALLEDLKAKDYQEEWAYELAYLYHRIGLATKCAEECDQIVLWFGNGPYVMKALELKMTHMPLTEKQQLKYDEMLYNAHENYGDDGYSDDAYSEDDAYAEDGMYSEDDAYANAYAYEAYTGTGYRATDSAEEGFFMEDDLNGEVYEEDGAYAGEGYAGEEDFFTEEYGSAGREAANSSIEGFSMEYYGDNYYSDDNFYTEQTYDGSENPAMYENDASSSYGKRQADIPQARPDSDMSKYNTINIEKVIAEGMKEISEDVFAEERESLQESDAAEEESKDKAQEISKEDLLLTKVALKPAEVVYYNEAPAPNMGSIDRVVLPDEGARAIKADTDIEELRSITERSVNEEHARMEKNLENVYRIAEPFRAEDVPFKPMTGQMNLDDVLSQWENIKLDNVKKHQEEIKKKIVTQTGKIFATFDDSLKGGILEELEREANAKEEDEDAFDLGITRIISNDDIKRSLANPQKEETAFKETVASEEEMVSAETEAFEEEYKPYEAGKADQEHYEESYEGNEEAYAGEAYSGEPYTDEAYSGEAYSDDTYSDETYTDEAYSDDTYTAEAYSGEPYADEYYEDASYGEEKELDPEDEQTIAEMAKEDAIRTHEIKLNTADLTNLSDKIVETAQRETAGAGREEIREFTDEEQKLFENFAVTKKIKKQIIYALESMTLAAFTGNVLITGERGIDTVRMAKNLIREFQALEEGFSGKVAKITGEKLNQKNLKEVFEKVDNGAIIIEKANGMAEEKLYELAMLLNQDNLGVVIIMEDTKKEITKLLEKQAMIADYFNIRIDLMEMDNNALVAYAKNYALALEYSIDEFGTLALYSRIANIQSGNHVVTKDEVREIIDEAIIKSKKFKVKNFVDVLFARRYDSEDMIVLKERDFM